MMRFAFQENWTFDQDLNLFGPKHMELEVWGRASRGPHFFCNDALTFVGKHWACGEKTFSYAHSLIVRPLAYFF